MSQVGSLENDYMRLMWGCQKRRLIAVVIVAFLENATIGYSLESVCVCVFPCLCVCVCFCMTTQKETDLGTRNWDTF